MFIVTEKEVDTEKKVFRVRILLITNDVKSAVSRAHQACDTVLESDLLPDDILFLGQSVKGNLRRLTSVYEVPENEAISLTVASYKGEIKDFKSVMFDVPKQSVGITTIQGGNAHDRA